MKAFLSKKLVLVCACMSFAISTAFASYIQCAIDCNGRIVHIFVPDGLTEQQQNEYIAARLESFCNEEEGNQF